MGYRFSESGHMILGIFCLGRCGAERVQWVQHEVGCEGSGSEGCTGG